MATNKQTESKISIYLNFQFRLR